MISKSLFKIFTLIIITVLICLICNNIYAEENYYVTMYIAGDSEVRENDCISLTAGISSINAGNGINAISAHISYDGSVFEVVSITGRNGWSISYLGSTNNIIAIRNSKVTSEESIFTVNLRAIKGNNSESCVSLTNIQASGGMLDYGGTGDINVQSTYQSVSVINVNNQEDISNSQPSEEEQYNLYEGTQTINQLEERNIMQTNRSLSDVGENSNAILKSEVQNVENVKETIISNENSVKEQISKTEDIIKDLIERVENYSLTTTDKEDAKEDFYDWFSKNIRNILASSLTMLVIIAGFLIFRKIRMVVL